MKVRGGVIVRGDADIQRARLVADVASGQIEVCYWTPDLFNDAAELIGRRGFTHNLRTLDALQLAVALELSKQGLLDQFVRSDRVLADVAALEGLTVLNPEAP